MQISNLKPFLRDNLDILFVGLNPAKGSSDNRHYFSVNQALWNQLYDSGLILKKVSKENADEIVFGSNNYNYNKWSYGITDLITTLAESNSGKITVKKDDCKILIDTIINIKPRVVVLLHQKVVKNIMTYLGLVEPEANIGQLGTIINNCNAMFYAIAFPHGNTILSSEKINNYKKVKDYLETNS